MKLADRPAVAYVASLGLALVLVSPALADKPKDSFPLSTFPMFSEGRKDGTVTAANSSSISDGASALLLMSAKTAAAKGLKPNARLLAHARHSQEPGAFTTAPIGAIRGASLQTRMLMQLRPPSAFWNSEMSSVTTAKPSALSLATVSG